jgi:Tfp pilus assembly protein PilP
MMRFLAVIVRVSGSLLLLSVPVAAADVPVQNTAADPYVYQPAGRRDPFLNVLVTGTEPARTPAKRGDGIAGLMVNEVAIRGVMQSGKTMLAMIQGPDGKSHMIRAGDKFMDGAVKAVTLQGLVIIQDVNDPLSLEKRREVRKLLKSAQVPNP